MSPAGKAPSSSWVRNKRTISKEEDEAAVSEGPWLNLWLGNLSPETVDEDLMAIFGKYGAMDSVTSYLPRPYAFVYFRTIEDAKAAKKALHGTVIRGKPIKIEFARPAKPGKTLWVGGISKSITKGQLENLFAKFGEIEGYQFLRHRGSAFICFQRIDDAINAQKSMNRKHLGGTEIRVDFQKSPPLRKDWTAEHDYRGTKSLLLPDQLLSSDERKYFRDTSPHHGIRRHLSFGGKRDEQPSNVLWVGYPPELQIDEELLHNSMILFGEIERIQSFPSRKYCYVEFRSVDEARRAKEGLQGRLLGDSRIQILYTSSEPLPGLEKSSLSGQEIISNELPPMGSMDLFGPGRSMPPNCFPGQLAPPHVIPRPNMLIRPFTHPHHGGSDFHEFAGGIRNIPDSIVNNSLPASLKRQSPSAPDIITHEPVFRLPFRPFQSGLDEIENREPKRSRVDGHFPTSEAHFQRRKVEGDGMSEFSGVPHPERNLPMQLRQTPDIQAHDPLASSIRIDCCWRGVIAKGGNPVCRARCLSIGNGTEAPFPDILNCSARTGLDMLTTHYSEAVGFDMVYFLPDSEEDFASYTEFLRYLKQRDRAGVAKFDDGTTMFLVPPSNFLTKVLKYSGPERLYGVVLKLPQQTAAPGQQPQAIMAPFDHVDSQLGRALQKSYGFISKNEEQSLKLDYSRSLHDRSMPHPCAERSRLVHSDEPLKNPLVPQEHPKSHETKPQAEVSLTPELIASLASLIPKNSHSSYSMPPQMPSSSAGIPSSFPGPLVHDNSVFMQGCGHNGRTAFSGISLEQLYSPAQNIPPLGHLYSNQAPLVPHFSAYTNIANGMDNSFQPAIVGMPIQEASLQMQQVPAIMGAVGNAVLSHDQFHQANDATNIYSLPIHPQIITTTPAATHNGSVLQIPAGTPALGDGMRIDLAGQVQNSLPINVGSGEGASEGDADKDQRYQSTLQFAASLLFQIQQQQQVKAQVALGSGGQL